jgi:alkylation response protein AidB-like acyl-CoA dehydrogenase
MDLQVSPEKQQAFRAEARGWLRMPTCRPSRWPATTRARGFEQHRAWEATLAEGGWSSVIWPDLGGRGADLIEWLIFEEEYHAAGAPMRVNQNGILLLGPTLMEFGTPEQKARFLPRMARCDDMWAQGWSEPNAGSDMAAISSRAIRDGDHYVLNGQKTWSTRAVFANWLFGLFRSDPQLQPPPWPELPAGAAGRTKGITIRPIRRSTASRPSPRSSSTTCACRWTTASATKGRAGTWRWPPPASSAACCCARRRASSARAAAGAAVPPPPRAGRPRPVDPRSGAAAWMDAEAYNLASYHTVGRLAKGGKVGAEASTNKIFWSELDLQMHETAMRILGPACRTAGRRPRGARLAGGLPVRAGRADLRRHQRDPAQHHRRARARPAEVLRRATHGLHLRRRPVRLPRRGQPLPDDRSRARDAARDLGNRTGPFDELRGKLAEQGLTALSVPEADGGLGLGDIDWALMTQELGYYAMPDSLTDTAYVAAGCWPRCRRSTRCAAPGCRAWPTAARIASATRSTPGWPTRTWPTCCCWRAGPRRAACGAARSSQVHASAQHRRLAPAGGVDWSPQPATCIAEGAGGTGLADAAARPRRARCAGQLVGLAQRMLDLSVDYAAQRKQFGKPIGTFQAVKHHLADVVTKIEFAKPVLYRAALAWRRRPAACAVRSRTPSWCAPTPPGWPRARASRCTARWATPGKSICRCS